MAHFPAVTPLEQDWIGPRRHLYVYLGRPGIGKKAKRTMARRERRRSRVLAFVPYDDQDITHATGPFTPAYHATGDWNGTLGQ
ncbi:hypothetical protein [Haloferula sp. BvORR071]|uniref:hypothetical protein n=1 Tax=Haloferula sp. BvORR071 TaxID=1396141 RepID=UPI00054EC9F0|nr:hypothetical protein [Haloferula sp. BvORR071]